MIKINTKMVRNFQDTDWKWYTPIVGAICKDLLSQQHHPNNMVGWMSWPTNFNKAELHEMKNIANKWQGLAKEKKLILVIVAIGGSYLGSRAAIDFIKGIYRHTNIEIMFLGNSMSPNYMQQALERLDVHDFVVNVISKSGTTIEPALSFHLLVEKLIQRYGEKCLIEKVVITTDEKKGVLCEFAKTQKITHFVVPANIGGRYSVLTAVGLFPMAVMGIDIEKVLEGAREAQHTLLNDDLETNPALKYAVIRNVLYKQGKLIEAYSSFEYQLYFFHEWVRQLFGETEGKSGMSIWPASCVYSMDLHSFGQAMQEGPSWIFETFFKIKNKLDIPVINKTADNFDHLNYLHDKKIQWINDAAYEGVIKAHYETAQRSIIELEFEKMDEYNFGYLVLFFFYACAVSARLLGVNPFDQPGVEIYKQNMFAILKKA